MSRDRRCQNNQKLGHIYDNLYLTYSIQTKKKIDTSKNSTHKIFTHI
jgi:hypothetical protein